MRTQHTPGPWVAEIGVRYIEIEGDDWVIAETDTYKVDAPPRLDCIANARLIAAAPELLGALQKAVARQGFSNGELLDARAAIDKAVGHNAGIQGRCAALSRSVPWNDWLGSVVDKATQNKCIKLLTIV